MNSIHIWTTLIFCMHAVSCSQTKEEMLDEAIILGKQKHYEEAIHVYSKVIKRNNRMQLAFYNRGINYIRTKQYKQALEDFNRVMALQTDADGNFKVIHNPDSPFGTDEERAAVPFDDALYQRAQVRFYMDSLSNSFLDFQWLIDNNYDQKSNCALWQGTIYIRSGKTDKACNYFDKAKRLASTIDDRQEADKMLNQYCDSINNDR